MLSYVYKVDHFQGSGLRFPSVKCCSHKFTERSLKAIGKLDLIDSPILGNKLMYLRAERDPRSLIIEALDIHFNLFHSVIEHLIGLNWRFH